MEKYGFRSFFHFFILSHIFIFPHPFIRGPHAKYTDTPCHSLWR